MIDALRNFLKLEASGGIVLVIAAALAIIAANSPLAGLYSLFIDLPVEIRIGPLHIAKPLLLWINDGFMAIFFFLIGLELKREVLDGELSDARKIVLPAFGAVGGMAVPAAIYAAFNWSDAVALKGWAIPAATDIAFALGVLALLGTRAPPALKVFCNKESPSSDQPPRRKGIQVSSTKRANEKFTPLPLGLPASSRRSLCQNVTC